MPLMPLEENVKQIVEDALNAPGARQFPGRGGAIACVILFDRSGTATVEITSQRPLSVKDILDRLVTRGRASLAPGQGVDR